MRGKVPLRWIENAEAQRVLAAARFEGASKPSRYKAGRAALAAWLARWRGRIALPARPGWPPLQMEPAFVRRPAPSALRAKPTTTAIPATGRCRSWRRIAARRKLPDRRHRDVVDEAGAPEPGGDQEACRAGERGDRGEVGGVAQFEVIDGKPGGAQRR